MDHAEIPIPHGELRPVELSDYLHQWAESVEYEFTLRSHATEYGFVIIRDPAGGCVQ